LVFDHVEGDRLILSAALLLRATRHAGEMADNAAHAASSGADFETLRIKGLTVALPGPQDTISFL
jgi:porin